LTRFGILGPFELWDAAGAAVPFDSDRARTLLALLLLQRDQICPADSLIDGVWGERPPRSARKNLQTYVWRLRHLLGRVGAARLEGRRTGYVLSVIGGEVDLDQFEYRAAGGERLLAVGAAEDASTLLADALRLWRGQPLGDVAFGEPPDGELVRLAERRMTVLENRIEADLLCGRAAKVVPELRKLVAEHPYRERLHAQLMLALSQSGRQVEALNVFSDIRSLLHREFGLDPGPALQQVQADILSAYPPPLTLPEFRGRPGPLRGRAGRDADGDPALAAVRAGRRDPVVAGGGELHREVGVAAGRRDRAGEAGRDRHAGRAASR
jgi:DNA-binding SARP family transcriptional activator